MAGTDMEMAQWFAVADMRSLPDNKPIAIQILDQSIFLWKSHHQLYAGYDSCPHRGTPLSLGSIHQYHIVCPYHGWQFDTLGRCTNIPAQYRLPPPRARLTMLQTHISHDLAFVTLSTETLPAPDCSQSPGRTVLCGPYDFAASAPRVVENFLDVAHFSSVHQGLLGSIDHPEIVDYPVKEYAWGIEASEVRVFQPNPDGSGQPAEVSYTYRVVGPYTAQLIKETPSGYFGLDLFATPKDPTHTQAWMVIHLAYHDNALPDDTLRQFQDTLAEQDRRIVESQIPKLLPLDDRELHIRADRLSVFYRKWLKTHQVRFGTC
ncbi:aromatic ring-hydroxylating oxygenase subunit alpha [Sulfobacillus thermosulfidooxidans]|uniref:aromatic ring-hydroxylating oxygenase subunit alpha n=1 Tax=Sulfobacillus thermosulfidooxidans TaxID=28034 RepID=UPI000423FBC3|nr:aromatic ring-hydroxylating dioxygenase subunit alpha [Sulfobacillus thermosulfidooxidans]